MLIHINISLSFCVNQDYVALNMLSQDEAGGEGATVWMRRREKSQLLICFPFCTKFNVERAIKCTK